MEAMDNMDIIDTEKESEAIPSLVTHIRGQWEKAKQVKMPIEQQDLRNKRQIDGIYEADVLEAIRSIGGSERFMKITDTKCRAAESWIDDIEKSIGETMWTAVPTPLPELPMEVEEEIALRVTQVISSEIMTNLMQTGQRPSADEVQKMMQSKVDEIKDKLTQKLWEIASEKARRMEKKIEDQLIQGGFYEALKEVTRDIIQYHAGYMKGIVLKKKKVRKWLRSNTTGKYNLAVADEIIPTFARINPFDIYTINGNFKGDIMERHRYSRSDLNDLKGVPGYRDDIIDKILEEYDGGGTKEWLGIDHERALLEKEDINVMHWIDCLEYWGSISGIKLIEWGMTSHKGIKIEPYQEYQIVAFLVNNYAFKVILNPHPLGNKPYYSTSFEKENNSVHGKGLPQKIDDAQAIINGAVRTMTNSLLISSLPQTEVDSDRLPPGSDIQSIWAGRIWPSTSKQMREGPALRFYQPNTVINEAISVYRLAISRADEDSGVPAFAHGGVQVGGAGNTASGLSILRSDAAKGLNSLYTNRDSDVISKVIEECYHFNMMYDEDDSIKGDIEIKIRGAASVIAKEQRILRLQEFLASTNNEVDREIITMGTRAKILKESARSLDIPGGEEAIRDDFEEGEVFEMVPTGPIAAPKKLQADGSIKGGKDFRTDL